MFHSEKMHIVERLTRVGDTIQYQATVDDPDVLVKPWVINHTLTKQSDQLEEAAPCVDRTLGITAPKSITIIPASFRSLTV